MEELKSTTAKAEQEIVSEKEQRKEEKKIATIKPHRGHTLYEVNMSTGEIVEATFEKTDIAYEAAINKYNVARRKVITKEGHYYVSALNKKNVVKKLNKQAKEYATRKNNTQ